MTSRKRIVVTGMGAVSAAGVGSIFKIEGSGEATKVEVLFADNTIKKFVAKYARLERV